MIKVSKDEIQALLFKDIVMGLVKEPKHLWEDDGDSFFDFIEDVCATICDRFEYVGLIEAIGDKYIPANHAE